MPRSATAQMSAPMPAATELGVEVSGTGPVVAVVVHGVLTARTAPVLRAIFDGVYRRRPVRVELDLTGVRHVDRFGVRTVLAARRRLVAQGAELAVRAGAGAACPELATVAGLRRLVGHERAATRPPTRRLTA